VHVTYGFFVQQETLLLIVNMKAVIILAALAAVALTADIENHPNCADCGSGGSAVFFPSETWCDRYYVCTGSTAREMWCPPALGWNDTAKACDWLCNDLCGNRPYPSPRP